MTRKFLATVSLCTFAFVACGKSSPSPVSPTVAGAISAEAAADGSTLKVTAPVPQSPVNGQQPTTAPTDLVVSNSAPKFAGSVPLTYRFEIFNGAGTLVHSGFASSGGGTTTYEVPVDLEGDKPYQWQARGEFQGAFGPWSSRASFVAPTSSGYIRGNELYDPLVFGKSIGEVHGPVTFIPGVGVKLDLPTSYIAYTLGATLEEGEMSALVTNVPQNTEGNKTKVFAAAEGFADLTTNQRRMTIEKRGDSQGSIAWRVITSADQIDTVGAERVGYGFQASLVYYWRATWGFNNFRLTINEGGVNGPQIYSFGKGYAGFYDPNPHVIYIGSPPTRSGPDNQSIQDMVIRQLWVSSRPRPAFAQK